MPIQTDIEITANIPDIIIKEKFEKCMLIDKTLPSERNSSMKYIEKSSKYKDMEIEINRVWGMKTEIVPIVIGATSTYKWHRRVPYKENRIY